MSDLRSIAVPDPLAHFRRFALDDAMLLFDRDTGWNALCDGPETLGLRMRAPRVVQFGITNRCNLACTFCSRDLAADSTWTSESAFTMLAGLADAGVLEVAFGGGEPCLFRGFAGLVRRLHDETPLAVHFTTNGMALTDTGLDAIRGCFGELRLSLYDDNDWRTRVRWLAERGERFGVNFLVTPARLSSLELTVLELVALGCRDVLLLSYNGTDGCLHLTRAQSAELAHRVASLARALRDRTTLKLDVCYGERMEPVPRLFDRRDCGAGREFIVLTSDRKLQPCSFHHVAIPVTSAADVLEVWRSRRGELAGAARDPGCARVPGYGLWEAS